MSCSSGIDDDSSHSITPDSGSSRSSSFIAPDIEIDDPFTSFDFHSYCTQDVGDVESQPLVPSSSKSVTQTLAILFTWFTSFPGMSNESSNLSFLLRKFVLSDGNKLPHSYTKALSLAKKLIIPAEVYDCCVNNCIIFRICSAGSFEDLMDCPNCGEARCYPHSKIARKMYKYLPMAPRIKRMFGSKVMSKLLQSHSETKGNQESSKISDIHESSA